MIEQWYNENNDILTEDMDELITIARTPQFGDSETETLSTYLQCEAFESRFDPSRSRAFHLASMIISRVNR